jgi:hypothetical protein
MVAAYYLGFSAQLDVQLMETITLPGLRKCVEKQLPKMSIHCTTCGVDPLTGKIPIAVHNSEQCSNEPGMNYCMDNNKCKDYCCGTDYPDLFAEFLISTMIHETAHNCNWYHGQGGGIPADPGPTDPKNPPGPWKPCSEWKD